MRDDDYDHNPYRTEPIDRDYNENSLSDYVSEYKKEIVFAGTTTGLLVTGYAAWNADKINDFLNGAIP